MGHLTAPWKSSVIGCDGQRSLNTVLLLLVGGGTVQKD